MNDQTQPLTPSDLRVGGLYYGGGGLRYGLIAIDLEKQSVKYWLRNRFSFSKKYEVRLEYWLSLHPQVLQVNETNVSVGMLFRRKEGVFRNTVRVTNIDNEQIGFINEVGHGAYGIKKFFKIFEFVSLSEDQLNGTTPF
jgi:hypothetical protein